MKWDKELDACLRAFVAFIDALFIDKSTTASLTFPYSHTYISAYNWSLALSAIQTNTTTYKTKQLSKFNVLRGSRAIKQRACDSKVSRNASTLWKTLGGKGRLLSVSDRRRETRRFWHMYWGEEAYDEKVMFKLGKNSRRHILFLSQTMVLATECRVKDDNGDTGLCLAAHF